MRYLVTKEIKSETQVIWKLYFQDFAFLLAWVALNYQLKEVAHLSADTDVYLHPYHGDHTCSAKCDKSETETISKYHAVFDAPAGNNISHERKEGVWE